MKNLWCFPSAHRSILGALLVIHAALLIYSAYVHSPTLNEPAHLAAGISHWQFRRFELYRVNPPLVRMVAALPVLAVGAQTDWSGFYEGPGARPVFAMGEKLIDANGEGSFWLFALARWACIPFSLVGGFVCYLWARDLYSVSAALLACALWCFSPNILAHASLITADASSAALGLAACYLFWRWIGRTTWRRVIVAGIVLGLAELTKTTLIIFYPLWPIMWILYRLVNRAEMQLRDWFREATMLLVCILIAIYVTNFGYGFEGSFKRLGEFQFVSNMFAGEKSEAAANGFGETWLCRLPVPFPENYLRGVDIQRRDIEVKRGQSYLRGEFKPSGWWYYYLYALMVKVPLGTWGLLLLTVVLRLVRKVSMGSLRDDIIVLLPATTILALISSCTGFNEHMRYVLPILPLLFIWISQITTMVSVARQLLVSVVWLFLLWTVASSLWVYPHSLSYFNELAGGPTKGHAHLIGSNIDWGQDLLYLQRWIEEHPQATPLHLAYFGKGNPRYAGIDSSGPRTEHQCVVPLNELVPGWYGISVNLLCGYSAPVVDGNGMRRRYISGAFSGFAPLTPVAMAGYSIYIYHITLEEANRVRRELGLSELPGDWQPPGAAQAGKGESPAAAVWRGG